MADFSDFTSYANETGARLSDQPLLFETSKLRSAERVDLGVEEDLG